MAPNGSYLFVQQAASALLRVQGARATSAASPEKPGLAFELLLSNSAKSMSFFSDRPQREAGFVPTSEFVGSFAATFRNENPNAALFGTNKHGNTSVVMLELCCAANINSTVMKYQASILAYPRTSTQKAYFDSFATRWPEGVITNVHQEALELTNIAVFFDNADEIPSDLTNLANNWLFNTNVQGPSIVGQILPGSSSAASSAGRRNLAQSSDSVGIVGTAVVVSVTE
jgi:hypothetical protein